jgi:hypothetical protein
MPKYFVVAFNAIPRLDKTESSCVVVFSGNFKETKNSERLSVSNNFIRYSTQLAIIHQQMHIYIIRRSVAI